MAERLASAEAFEARLADENAQASERVDSLQTAACGAARRRKPTIEGSCEQTRAAGRGASHEKSCASKSRRPRSKANGTQARTRTAQIEETLRGQRQSLDELRAERSQRQIEKARNDADRDYLRQTCVAELNAQPEELMAQQDQQL